MRLASIETANQGRKGLFVTLRRSACGVTGAILDSSARQAMIPVSFGDLRGYRREESLKLGLTRARGARVGLWPGLCSDIFLPANPSLIDTLPEAARTVNRDTRRCPYNSSVAATMHPSIRSSSPITRLVKSLSFSSEIRMRCSADLGHALVARRLNEKGPAA